jgi:hypothetical protein
MTHTEAAIKFKRCRNNERGYLLAANTRLQKRGNAFAVKYHNTDVVMIRPDGTFRLDSGGWRTSTTKNRMNDILPNCIVSQNRHTWHVSDGIFYDRILIGHNGETLGEIIPNDHRLSCIQKNVNSYCSKFVQAASNACVGRYIGSWESHKRKKPPSHSDKRNAVHLWRTIKEACFDQEGLWQSDLSRFYHWVHISVLAAKYTNPKLIWDTMVRDCSSGFDSSLVKSSMTKMLRISKPMIIDQILLGNCSKP